MKTLRFGAKVYQDVLKLITFAGLVYALALSGLLTYGLCYVLVQDPNSAKVPLAIASLVSALVLDYYELKLTGRLIKSFWISNRSKRKDNTR